MSQVFFKNNPIKLEKNVPALGSRLTNIQFTDASLKDHDLSSLNTSGLILWFVPSLDTGTCLTSAKKLNEHLKKHPGKKALILSMDLPFAQKRVCGLEHLEHVMTGSLFRHKETLQNLGLLIAEGPMKGLSARCVMVLDAHHNLTYLELVQEMSEEPNYTPFFHFIDKL
jgi:thiol peroxidase